MDKIKNKQIKNNIKMIDYFVVSWKKFIKSFMH